MMMMMMMMMMIIIIIIIITVAVHTMKTLRGGCVGLSPLILNLGTIWRSVVSFMPQPL